MSPSPRFRNLTGIDRWFLEQIHEVVKTENEIRRYSIDNIPPGLHKSSQRKRVLRYTTGLVNGWKHNRRGRIQQTPGALGIKRVYKMVDTCSAEFPSPTNYYYSTFEEESESASTEKKKIIVLGSGPNRIGQGIEFDYSCVHGILAAREAGYEAIMLNCNPETVSTDFDMADKLYFEPVYWEHLVGAN